MPVTRAFGRCFSVVLTAAVLGGCDAPPTPQAGIVAAVAKHGFAVNDTPAPLPELAFRDGDGRALSVADFRGRVVVLNIWATWCGPCREEMPTLDNLQGNLGGPDLEVIALSVDDAGPEVIRKFFDDIGVQHLRLYIERPRADTLSALNLHGIPATLLLDREGREIGRRLGAAEWDAPEMLELFRQVIEER